MVRFSAFFVAFVLGSLPTTVLAQSSAKPVVAAPSPDPAKLSEARSIIAVIMPPAEREGMMRKMMEDLVGPMQERMLSSVVTDEGLKKLLNEMMDTTTSRGLLVINEYLPSMVESMAIAYADEFTLAELKEISAFARTPTGKRYLGRSAALVGHPSIKAANLAMMTKSAEVSKEVMKIYLPRIVDYIKAHPEAADDAESVFGQKRDGSTS